MISYNLKKKILVKQTGIFFYWVVDEKEVKYIYETQREQVKETLFKDFWTTLVYALDPANSIGDCQW